MGRSGTNTPSLSAATICDVEFRVIYIKAYFIILTLTLTQIFHKPFFPLLLVLTTLPVVIGSVTVPVVVSGYGV